MSLSVAEKREARERIAHRRALQKRLEDPILRARYLNDPLPAGWPTIRTIRSVATKDLELLVNLLVVPYEKRQQKLWRDAQERRRQRSRAEIFPSYRLSLDE